MRYLIAVFVAALLFWGCGPSKRPKVQVNLVGYTYHHGFWVSFHGDGKDISPERKAKLLRAISRAKRLFCEDWQGTVPELVIDVFDRKDGQPVPVSYPNGGGAYTTLDRRVWVGTGTKDTAHNLYHELFHNLLHRDGQQYPGNDADPGHTHPKWPFVHQRVEELRNK